MLERWMPATPAPRARPPVASRIAAAWDRCWVYGSARMVEWQRVAQCRRLIRISAEIEASHPYWRE